MKITDRKMDDAIRAALKDADKKGQLSVVAAITGIGGGTDKLRNIMNSTGDIHIMDRSMLGMYLKK